MPILDSSGFADDDALPDLLRCDVCIIGAGPAGITIARELSGTQLRITLLESGGTERQEETDALNEIESVGWPRVMDQWLVRNRIVGGSSSTWTGRCAPFDEIDLQFRDWVPNSGWPLEIDHLIPYLDRSAKYLGLGVGNGITDARVWELTGHRQPKPGPDPDKLLPMFWQFSRDPINRFDRVRFGRRIAEDLGPNVTLVTNATVLHIDVTESGTGVESVEFAATGGRRFSLPASTVVLCAGGIENARLLLSSDKLAPQGLGNDRGLVGRFLMDHPRGTVARFPMEKAKAVVRQFGVFKTRAADSNLYQRGMRLSPAIQRSEQLVNCAIWLGEHVAPDDPWDPLMRFLRREADVHLDLGAMLMNSGLLVHGLKEYFIAHRVLPRKLHAVTLDAMCEQLPNPDSRLTLSDRRDRLGMRIPRIDWRVSESEALAMRRITELMAEHLSHMGLEPPVPEDWVRDGAMLPRTIRDVAHPAGTTRMADDPARGVVDAQCQVHGVQGLFIGGSSVFPTSGHANPTQMIVALALRLADKLKDRATAFAEIALSEHRGVSAGGGEVLSDLSFGHIRPETDRMSN
jgi:choline dehydrogenase-like flavoprotein